MIAGGRREASDDIDPIRFTIVLGHGAALMAYETPDQVSGDCQMFVGPIEFQKGSPVLSSWKLWRKMRSRLQRSEPEMQLSGNQADALDQTAVTCVIASLAKLVISPSREPWS